MIQDAEEIDLVDALDLYTPARLLIQLFAMNARTESKEFDTNALPAQIMISAMDASIKNSIPNITSKLSNDHFPDALDLM